MSAVPLSSFDAFFEAHVDFVVRSLRRLGVHGRDAEDVAQEVFVVAMRRVEPLGSEWSPRAYLWGVLRRQAADYRRLARHRTTLGEPPEHVGAAAPHDGIGTAQLVHRALAKLPDERRDVLVLYEIEGLTLDEIALAISIPANTVASRLRKARQEFESAIVELERDDGSASTAHEGRAREPLR